MGSHAKRPETPLYMQISDQIRKTAAGAILDVSVKTRDNDIVPIVPRGLVDQTRIKAGVQRAKRALESDVKRIMYSFTSDWTGEQSLFFRIILSDEATSPSRLRATTQRVTRTILHEIQAEELGLQTYFNFRSQSEQATLREPAWEP